MCATCRTHLILIHFIALRICGEYEASILAVYSGLLILPLYLVQILSSAPRHPQYTYSLNERRQSFTSIHNNG
jgi:hypothetical protein